MRTIRRKNKKRKTERDYEDILSTALDPGQINTILNAIRQANVTFSGKIHRKPSLQKFLYK